MPKRKNARAVAAKRKLYMREKRRSVKQTDDADMGKAKPLATGRASPRKSEKMSGPNAPGIAPTGGRLCTRNFGMPASSDSPAWDCTRTRVPWPVEDSLLSGLAEQSKLVTKEPISIISGSGASRVILRDNYEQKQNYEQNNVRIKSTNKNNSLQLFNVEVHEPINEHISNYVSISAESQGIQGNFHQGNIMFGPNAGSQCVANCLSAVSYQCLKDVSMWGPSDLDNILVTGDELYSFLRRNLAPTENYLLIHELPRELECYDTRFQYIFKESVASLIEFDNSTADLADFNAFPLNEALQISLIESHACFVCFGGNTMIIGKAGESFFAFDSHSRSQTGMLDVNGKSSCIILESITDVFNHLRSLAMSMGYRSNTVCEVTGVSCESSPVERYDRNDEINDQGDADVVSAIIDLERDVDHSDTMDVSENDNAGDSSYEVEFVSVAPSTNNFIPFTTDTKHSLCRYLNISNRTISVQTPVVKLNAREPKDCVSITGDGNCFFRALSYSVSGTEENFQTVRQKVCCHISNHKDLFLTVLRDNYEDVDQYLEESNMQQDGTWATEVEIFAAAHILKSDIYTYSQGRWLKYSGKTIDHSLVPHAESVYLNHVNMNHYEVVVDVEACDIDLKSFSEGSIEKEFVDNSKKRFSTEWKTRRVNQRKQLRREMRNVEISEKARKDARRNVIDQEKLNVNICAKVLKKQKQYNEKKQSLKQKYQKDEAYRNKLKMFSCKRYKGELREQILTTRKCRYSDDKKYRESIKQTTKHKYTDDVHHRINIQQTSKQKYDNDKKYRNKLRQASKRKYRDNEHHRDMLKEKSKLKYKEDEKHKDMVKETSKRKYKEDKRHRDIIKETSKRKYKEDERHRDMVKETSKQKYKEDEKHRENLKQASKQKYKDDDTHRQRLKQLSKQNYQERKSRMSELQKDQQFLIQSFRSKVLKGPSYVCCCCHRLLFENQVQNCNKEQYISRPVGKCISDQYFHTTCDENCSQNCTQNRLWICKTCHRKINSDEIPAEAAVNNMSLEQVPEPLKNLNRLEQHLIAKHIPFMKIMALPQGGQQSVRGPVVCVPSEIKKVTSLPRSENENLLLRVKLKRKITFKGHYEYSFVDTQHVIEALEFLKKNNKWYRDLVIDSSWENTLSGVNEIKDDDSDIANKDISKNAQDESQPVEEMLFETCLQPVDIGQEVLDHHFNEIYNLAPSEGKNPVKLLQEEGNEAKTFPTHFPSGINTWKEKRDSRITLSRYVNNRLMNADGRFAKDSDYIFFSQYLSELNQVIEKTQISLRKCHKEPERTVSKEMINDPEALKKLFRDDEAFRFLQPIRGTPAYWQSAQKDLFAMLRQLGIPTWFCSFSAAEFRWTEIIQSVLDIQKDNRNPDDLSWTEKSEVLRSNPVTVARMIDRRFHVFLNEVILSAAEPIGKVVDYFYRVEFQQRGSPHMHCLFWVDKAPKLETDSMETISEFIDKYVTCEIPAEGKDMELRQIVQEVQQHSKKHSKSCKKKGTECRFNFPRPPSSKTFISVPCENDTEERMQNNEGNNHKKSLSKEKAKMILQKIWESVLDENISVSSASELFDKLSISQDLYEEAHNLMTQKQNIVLKRNANEMWINQYNPQLLKCWNANMDIQYILDPFSCIVYVLSYISKSEREMGMLLKQTKLEAEEGNLHAREVLKKVGSTYLNHREVSAQEAVYRVCNLKMKECSRKVVFVPVGENPTRLSKPLSQIQTKNKSADDETDSDEDIWMMNNVERYLARPADDNFENMCLATFCSEYRVLAKSQVPQKETQGVFKLQNNKGYVQKRTKTQPAVIRFPKFNIEKSPEKYFQSILQLFLPYRSDLQLKPPGYEQYQMFYETGHIRFTRGDALLTVKEIVDHNHKTYSTFENIIETAQEAYEQIGEAEDAWAMLCPEAELSRNECLVEKEKHQDIETEDNSIIPDIEDTDSHFADVMHFVQQDNLPRDQVLHLMRSLNEKQRNVFYYVRNWALQVKQGENPDAFHIFVTGGAGTGKSHLIKTLNYEATRLLSQLSTRPDDTTVLLTAFTGTAAFNIGGCTIHHAFSLNKFLPLPYEPLKEQNLNAIRAKLQNVKILIIDEVSMVYKRLLYYIHERLVQIKGDKRPFGGVSVIAVGDFYQLPPVKQRKDERLFKENLSYPIDYWNSVFKVIELDKVVRQNADQSFAQMLNTIRTRTSDNPLPSEAKHMLMQCLKDGDDDALHVYSTNQEVNDFNLGMLRKQCTDLTEINAKDYQRDKKSGKMKIRDKPFTQTKDDGLQSCLLLAINARVMLTRNSNVADGLVNGVMGTVTDIIYNEQKSEVKGIEVAFDNANVAKHSGKKKYGGKNTVVIERIQEELSWRTAANSVRYQFPLKLSWACTAHKVQGMTVNKIVVNLNRIFSPGQAYVALSRVTTLQGLSLEINDFSTIDQKIYADAELSIALKQMEELCFSVEPNKENICTIVLHNVQSLKNNIQNIQSEDEILKADVMCFTETWLQTSNILSETSIRNFRMQHIPRSLSYNEEDEYFARLKVSNGGGVCVYIKESSDFELVHCSVTNLETIIVQSQQANITVATVYRPPSYAKSKFINNMQKLVYILKDKSETTVIMGDFNEDSHSQSNQINNFFATHGYTQLVNFPTTESGTILDHVYCSNSDRLIVKRVPTFYSYHEALQLRIKDV